MGANLRLGGCSGCLFDDPHLAWTLRRAPSRVVTLAAQRESLTREYSAALALQGTTAGTESSFEQLPKEKQNKKYTWMLWLLFFCSYVSTVLMLQTPLGNHITE